MKLNFIGATHDVTGSMTLLETDLGKFLIDSGLYQGPLETAQKNLKTLPFDPKDINAIFLTHAHLDHSGFIPRLIKLGFRGNIFCTPPTMKLAKLIMNDSAHILEESDNHSLKNFYSIKDAEIANSLFIKISINKMFEFMELKITYLPAGHILGAASIHINDGRKNIIFSGDLGRSDDPFLFAPSPCPPVDLVVMESTYGDRVRTGDLNEELIAFLKKIKSESRVGLIASFSVARAQMLITLIQRYFEKHPNEKFRFVIDGPMMDGANKIYREYNAETKFPEELLKALGEVEVIKHTREWESLKKKQGPLLVISSSGMVTGGRIWRYLENWQHDPTAILFLPGYQGEGTPGKDLSEGKRMLKQDDETFFTWSGEVLSSQSFSSHADQGELISWLKDIPKETIIYLNHGEDQSKVTLKNKLIELGYINAFIAGASTVEV